MRLSEDATREVLADAWLRWSRRCTELTADEWAAPTRCAGWHVAALVAHVCPEPAMFDRLASAVTAGPAAITDAAIMLRRFNEPDGIAHTSAGALADQAITDAGALTPAEAARRFDESAHILGRTPMPHDTVIAYPAVGSVTLAVIAEAALMEATVHLLDLAHAVGGVAPSSPALEATRDLLIAVPDPHATVEALAGRVPPEAAMPAIR